MALIQYLGLGLEVFQIPMIGQYSDLVGSPLEEVTPLLESYLDCQKFLIVDVIVPFVIVEAARVKSAWVESAIGVHLG